MQQSPLDADVSRKARETLNQLGATPVQAVSIRKVPLAVAFVWNVSDDGRFIAYEKPGAGYNLHVYETTTGKSWSVYDGGGDANKEPWNVVFSPDNREIAYSIHGLILFVANLDGTHQRRLFERKTGTGNTWFTGWLVQTRQLLVDSWDSETKWRALLSMDVSSGATKELGRFTDTASLEGWDLSPDGRFLVRRKRSYPRAITLVDLATKGEVTLVEHDATRVFGWFADGSKLIYSQARTGGIDLCTIELKDGRAAGEPEVIWPNIGAVEPGGVTRDGSIYYVVRDEKTKPALYGSRRDFLHGILRNGRIAPPPKSHWEKFSPRTTPFSIANSASRPRFLQAGRSVTHRDATARQDPSSALESPMRLLP